MDQDGLYFFGLSVNVQSPAQLYFWGLSTSTAGKLSQLDFCGLSTDNTGKMANFDFWGLSAKNNQIGEIDIQIMN